MRSRLAAMRAVVQRVTRASVRVGEETVGSIARGLLVLVGVAAGACARSGTAAQRTTAHSVSNRIMTDSLVEGSICNQ